MSDITWTPIRIRLGELKPWAENPKFSSKKDAENLIATEKEFGQPIPFCVSPFLDGGKVDCYDGHQRLSAWQTVYGLGFEVWAFQSDRHLTEQERRDFVLKIHNARGGWDWDKLSAWDTDTLKSGWFDSDTLKGWKADVTALGEFLKSEQPAVDAEPEIDRAAELLEKWQVKTGDMFQIGEHRLICGDCTDAATVARVMGGEKAGMLFTDAPYNTGETWSGLQEYRGHEQVENDNREDWQEWASSCFALWLEHALDKDLAGYWWFGQRESPRELLERAGMKIRGHIVWVKEHYNVGRADYHSQYEECQYFSRGERHYNGARNQSDVRTANRVEEERLHPTQKPVSLFQGLIEQHDIDLVLEPFSGSGTTLVACQNLGRKCRAIEISPAYVAVALERMSVAFPALEIRRIE